MCAAGAPIFVRTYSSVMSFPVDQIDGLAALRVARWRIHPHDESSLVSSDKNAIAWYGDGAWHVARRHRTACFDPTADHLLVRDVLGAPDDSFVIPTTIVVPLKEVSLPSGEGCHCRRIYPTEHEPPHELSLLGEQIEFRICVSKHEGLMRTFVEATLGGARFTGRNPRRAVYLPDHKLLPNVQAEALVAAVLLYLPKFTHRAGFVFDPRGERSDIPRVGSYGVLPRHGSFYGELRWPAPSPTAVVAFDAIGGQRIARSPVTSATIVDEQDELACAISSRSQKLARPKSLPIVASLPDAVRSMKLAKELVGQQIVRRVAGIR